MSNQIGVRWGGQPHVLPRPTQPVAKPADFKREERKKITGPLALFLAREAGRIYFKTARGRLAPFLAIPKIRASSS